MNFEIDTLFIAAQAIGFVATGIGIASYQAKRRYTLLVMQTTSNMMWLIHYLMLGSLSAVFANLIGIIRNIVYSFRGKYKFVESKLVPAAAIAACLITGIFTYNGPFDTLPIIGMMLASVAFYIEDEKIIRYISIFIALSWITFGIYARSIASVVSDGMTLISVIVAIFRYRNFEIYDKTTFARNDMKDDSVLSENEK